MQGDKEMSQNQSIKVIIRKKPINIPIFHNKPPTRNRFETDGIRKYLKTNPALKVKIVDVKLKEIPKIRMLNVSTYNFSQTPTPTPRKELKASYFSQSFDTPSTAKHTSNTLSADYREHANTAYSSRKTKLNSNICSKIESQIKVFKEKMTMKDLNLNLPVIIKSKKMRKRILYKPNFA